VKRRPSEILIMEKIYEYLMRRPESSISRISTDCGMNRRTVTKYLELFSWVKNRSRISEHKGKRGARVFSIDYSLKQSERMNLLKMYYEDYSYVASQIRKIASILNLPRKTLETALDAYVDLVAEGLMNCEEHKEVFREDMPAASVYLACRMCKTPRTLQEIAKSCNIDEESIKSSCSVLGKAFRGKFQIKLALVLSSSQEVRLRADNVKQEDFGKALARIDNRIMQKLGISARDPIEIIGKRTTSVSAWPAYKEDQNLDIIRIDGFTRKNAGVAINEYVTVRPAKAKEALGVTLEPIHMRLTVDKDFTNFVKNNLLARTFIKGDTTFVTLLGHHIPFIVTKTRPQGIVKITTNTKITVLKEKAKLTSEDVTDS